VKRYLRRLLQSCPGNMTDCIDVCAANSRLRTRKRVETANGCAVASTVYSVTHFMLMRVGADGSSSNIDVQDWQAQFSGALFGGAQTHSLAQFRLDSGSSNQPRRPGSDAHVGGRRCVADEQGEEIYPRKWNHEFIDLPLVEKDKQNTPSFSSEVMTGLARWKKKRERMIFVLCGAGGLRVGEALGIEIDEHISPDFLTIFIQQKVHHGRVEQRLKTANGCRQVDLHPTIATFLKEFVGKRATGFLFCTRQGKPVSPSNIIRRHLHKALKELGYVNPFTGTHKAGNHAFRRFRNTYLRNYAQCPEGLYKYWMGPARKDMSDLYDKIKEDVAFRRSWAERCGFGFQLPSVVPNVPKCTEKTEAAIAA